MFRRLGMASLVAGALLAAGPAAAAAPPLRTAGVLAPLEIRTEEEMRTFERLLDEARAAGVDTVSIDVWWGKVEARGDQRFDWRYYDTVFAKVRARGLKLAPIISFHGCGGGPGDDCDIPVPAWLYGHFARSGLAPDDLRYESETGRTQSDAIAPWATAWPRVLKQHAQLMRAFAQRYRDLAPHLTEINVSLGPTGELRYPAYNASDGWSYPARGFFQAYSRVARADFRRWALARFGGLAGVARRWSLPLAGPEDIDVPGGDLPTSAGPRAEAFVAGNDHVDTAYGRDFVDWYNGSLVKHGRRILMAADEAFAGPLKDVPLGMKIPGIHWQIKACSPRPRIAEITAGLVQTRLDLRPVPAARPDAFGYEAILGMVAAVERRARRPVILHFTAAEIDDDAVCGPDGSSLAQTLVQWISQGALDRGLEHKAENALACVDNPGDDRSWANIRFVYARSAYTGFTLLRLSGKPDCGAGRSPWEVDRGPFASFIRDFR